MYICVCRAVTGLQVREAIEGGAGTVEEVTRVCCAGDDCGACHEQIAEMIAAHRDADAAVSLPVLRGGRAA